MRLFSWKVTGFNMFKGVALLIQSNETQILKYIKIILQKQG